MISRRGHVYNLGTKPTAFGGLVLGMAEDSRRKRTFVGTSQIANPAAAAELGETIYRERYQERFEFEHSGKFVAINIATGEATLGDTAEGALDQAHDLDSSGFFPLIRVRHAGAFRLGY